MPDSPHSFHIPVMGTGFTLDSPLRVGRYGIDSVVSLGDDQLMERLRRHYSEREGLPFEPVRDEDGDPRARRVTAWLDFMDARLRRQSLALRASEMAPGSDLWRYFELLPEGALKSDWKRMLEMNEGPERWVAESALRRRAVPGRIDVNIMTKVDRAFLPSGEALAPDSTDALSGLRGFARSKLDATVVFSAGMNPRLYGYLASFDDFFPDKEGRFKKRVCLKVGDFRSAEVQGRFLAKKGIWVGEFRVESGLNCGGHAFAPQGRLFGPILEEFHSKLSALRDELYMAWSKAVAAKRGWTPEEPRIKLSAQGGVGTAGEQRQLTERYGVSSVGWGTPFLLVPEATLVDEAHRRKLCEAGEDGVELSDASPLGIPFWNLKNSSSEDYRRRRIAEGTPGSPCKHAYLTFNTEFGPKPICTSSAAYQRRKLEALGRSGLEGEALEESRRIVTARACICKHLGGAAEIALGLERDTPVAVCPGPNIAWFHREAGLDEMVGHIYGRSSLFTPQAAAERPHMFLAELTLSLKFLARELRRSAMGVAPRSGAYFEECRANLLNGMDYYQASGGALFARSRGALEEALAAARAFLSTLPLPQAAAAA